MVLIWFECVPQGFMCWKLGSQHYVKSSGTFQKWAYWKVLKSLGVLPLEVTDERWS
jgi:hypothetical protein